ncbi:hypothetical protein ACQKK5_22925, partial [Brevibacillus panacihumi]|uniref:hypothetical protein n=1 Tax=Brevibacillus panacihumi TaxID=497735 RepID=UPI003D05DF45
TFLHDILSVPCRFDFNLLDLKRIVQFSVADPPFLSLWVCIFYIRRGFQQCDVRKQKAPLIAKGVFALPPEIPSYHPIHL